MIKALNPVVYDYSCILSTACSPLWFVDIIDILEAEGTHCVWEIIKLVTWAICMCASAHLCVCACMHSSMSDCAHFACKYVCISV